MEKGNDESSNLLSVARCPLSVDLKNGNKTNKIINLN